MQLPASLEFSQINFELLGSGIHRSHLVDGLDSLGRNSHSNLSSKLVREETLPLQVDLLNLLDSLMRECNNTRLTVGCLAQQVADTSSHLHRGSSIALGRNLSKVETMRYVRFVEHKLLLLLIEINAMVPITAGLNEILIVFLRFKFLTVR